MTSPVKKDVEFSNGPLLLEGVLASPAGQGPFPAVVICHPHPLYGGSMDNNVVNAIAESLARASFLTLKFNFRGVGLSQGKHSGGSGEQEDVGAAIDYLAGRKEADTGKLGLAGYSAGAAYGLPVAAADPRIKSLAGISPPLTMSDFGFLKNCRKHKLLLAGEKDDFTDINRFLEFARALPEPCEFAAFRGVDHFWCGSEPLLAGRVTDFFTRTLI